MQIASADEAGDGTPASTHDMGWKVGRLSEDKLSVIKAQQYDDISEGIASFSTADFRIFVNLLMIIYAKW